jgi:membrane protein implicated in regulation of membrane protease activity
MALDASGRRRWFGAVVLLAALAMLLCGQTVLKARLGALAFIAYWLVCFGLTGLAILIALLDVRALQRRSRQQQRDLFETTLRQIETESKNRPHQSGDRHQR